MENRASVDLNDAVDLVGAANASTIGTDVLNFRLYFGGGGATPWPNRAHQVIVGLVLGSICVVTVTGNLLVLLAVSIDHNLRSATHFFVANLASADLLLGTSVLPFSASLEVLDYWAFGQVFCDVWAALDVLCCTASILSLCVISIDRYIGVTRPLQHSLIVSEFRAAYVILGVWLLSVAISVAPLFGWKDPPSDDPFVCNVTRDTGYVLFSVSGSFYVPLAVILVVYYRVYREALSQSRFLATGIKVDERHGDVTLRCHTGNKTTPTRQALIGCGGGDRGASYRSTELGGTGSQSRETLVNKIAKFNREKKAAKTLGIVVGVFILCWFPFFFVLPLGMFLLTL